MKKIKLGILGTSEIAFRRFLPALQNTERFAYIGVASRTLSKTKSFVDSFGGKGYGSYDELLEDSEIEAVYIPLPPALHYEWASKALNLGKHVFLEKPSTVCFEETEKLVRLAEERELALQENYMFIYHSQLRYIQDMIAAGEIGDLRQIRIAFSFPKREKNDFRYNKTLGGGALLDCGGYTVKLASILLGESARVSTAMLNSVAGYDVDIYGSATIENEDGLTAQVAFGMDNSYKCELEITGSRGNLRTERIFTAPPSFQPSVIVKVGNEEETRQLPCDDQFLHAIEDFHQYILDKNRRNTSYSALLLQEKLVNDIIKSNSRKEKKDCD